ncbi:MAG: hypothetical protein J7521_03090 [Caulobacter sp.]|nr:hypothetical protein [Caulobacter sp.]
MSILSLVETTPVASPLLRLIAPDYAEVLAALWPAPHTAFITAPAARRHLVCLALALDGRRNSSVDLTQLLVAPLRKAARLAVSPAPEGLPRAVEQLGEIAWSPRDYRDLVALLGRSAPAKTLRHANGITPGQVRTLATLPEPLRDAGGVVVRVTPDQADLLAEAHVLLGRRLPAQVLAGRIQAWIRAPTAKALFNLVADDFRRELPKAPHPGTDRLKPLETAQAIRDAARRYRNCLANYVDYAADQQSAIYEWLPAPGAVVELTPDAYFGWRLDQARLENNKSVDEATREAIVEELRGMGIHVGRSAWQIRRALERAGSSGFTLEPLDAAIAEYFRDD